MRDSAGRADGKPHGGKGGGGDAAETNGAETDAVDDGRAADDMNGYGPIDADAAEVDIAEGGGGAVDSAEATELRKELQYVNDRHLRLAAEFDNYRRRVQAQLGESGHRAQAELVGRILEVLDDLRRVTTLDPGTASVESVLEGVVLLERKLLQGLMDAGLEEMEPVDEPFDPNTMEAITRASAESEDEDDTVAQVFQRGFRFRGHLVRPARVSVRKHD